jgi:hypothetical protein
MEKCHGDFNRPVPERLVFERPLLVALELSKATWVVALSAPLSDRIRHHSITGGDAAALLKLIGQARSRAEAALGQPVRVVCCYEAGYDGFWLHRVLTAHGIDNHCSMPPACWSTAGRLGSKPTVSTSTDYSGRWRP